MLLFMRTNKAKERIFIFICIQHLETKKHQIKQIKGARNRKQYEILFLTNKISTKTDAIWRTERNNLVMYRILRQDKCQ